MTDAEYRARIWAMRVIMGLALCTVLLMGFGDIDRYTGAFLGYGLLALYLCVRIWRREDRR